MSVATCDNCGQDEHSEQELARCLWSVTYRGPDQTCEYPMRDGVCQMEADHRGRHSTVVFYCESCGKTRRGRPHAVSVVRLSDGSIDDEFGFCFMCVLTAEDRRIEAEDAYYANLMETTL